MIINKATERHFIKYAYSKLTPEETSSVIDTSVEWDTELEESSVHFELAENFAEVTQVKTVILKWNEL